MLITAVIFQAAIIVVIIITPVFAAGIFPMATTIIVAAVIIIIVVSAIIFFIIIIAVAPAFRAAFAEFKIGFPAATPSHAALETRTVAPAVTAGKILPHTISAIFIPGWLGERL